MDFQDPREGNRLNKEHKNGKDSPKDKDLKVKTLIWHLKMLELYHKGNGLKVNNQIFQVPREDSKVIWVKVFNKARINQNLSKATSDKVLNKVKLEKESHRVILLKDKIEKATNKNGQKDKFPREFLVNKKENNLLLKDNKTFKLKMPEFQAKLDYKPLKVQYSQTQLIDLIIFTSLSLILQFHLEQNNLIYFCLFHILHKNDCCFHKNLFYSK